MKSVWVVEVGEYSDRCVSAVFSKRGPAKVYARLVRGDVTGWNLDDHKISLRRGCSVFDMCMGLEGEDARADVVCEGDVLTSVCSGKHESRWGWEILGANYALYKFHSYVVARNARHAIKVVNERRAASKSDPGFVARMEKEWGKWKDWHVRLDIYPVECDCQGRKTGRYCSKCEAGGWLIPEDKRKLNAQITQEREAEYARRYTQAQEDQAKGALEPTLLGGRFPMVWPPPVGMVCSGGISSGKLGSEKA